MAKLWVDDDGLIWIENDDGTVDPPAEIFLADFVPEPSADTPKHLRASARRVYAHDQTSGH